MGDHANGREEGDNLSGADLVDKERTQAEAESREWIRTS